MKSVASAKVPSILARCVGEGALDFMTELVAAALPGDEPADLGYWIGAEICRSCLRASNRSRVAANTPGSLPIDSI